MKIAITGTHSTGKTTLLNSIKQDVRSEEMLYRHKFFNELTRTIYKRGVTINESGDDMTQLLTNNVHINNLLEENFISDRCIIDSYSYTRYLYQQGKVSKWVYDYSYKLLQELCSKYDYIFWLRPEFDLQVDDVRSNDIQFQKDIDKIIEETIFMLDIKVHVLTGDVKNRTEQIFYQFLRDKR